jgi:predicted alpha/beta-fold hydrolase
MYLLTTYLKLYFTSLIFPAFINLHSSVWHPGLYDDSKMVLRHIDRNIPGSHIFLVGFSAGTNIVQKTLLDKSLGVKILAAMCVCVSSDYIAGRDNLEDTFQGRVYSRLMATIYKVYESVPNPILI